MYEKLFWQLCDLKRSLIYIFILWLQDMQWPTELHDTTFWYTKHFCSGSKDYREIICFQRALNSAEPQIMNICEKMCNYNSEFYKMLCEERMILQYTDYVMTTMSWHWQHGKIMKYTSSSGIMAAVLQLCFREGSCKQSH